MSSDNTTRTFHPRPNPKWGPGEWDNEPDRVQWQDGDYVCLILRGDHGAWCGYVGVPPGHPWHGIDGASAICDTALDSVDVHGGITFSDKCMPEPTEGEPMNRVCHIPEPGQPDEVWWQGFDCLHSGDVHPSSDWALRRVAEVQSINRDTFGRRLDSRETYRNIAYAKREVSNLVRQARSAA